MITSRSLFRALVLPAVIAAVAYSQAKAPDEVAACPHPVGFTVSLDRSTFETREPVIAGVVLTNLGDRALRLLACDGGAPRRMALEVSRGDGPYTEHSLWLERNGPQAREIELARGGSTSGDILLLLDYGKEYVFPEAGRYHLRWNFYPGSGSALIYTDEVQVRVIPSSRVNEECLAQLELVALRYYAGDHADTLDLNAPEAKEGLDHVGIQLLGKIISRTKPHLIDPDDDRETKLLDSLAETLERYPDSVYSGYIARYLGLVYLKTLEHE
ncbi:MAG: hypothetical protein JSU86_07620, partial [Phycisphaerales bacterium]